MSRLFSLVIVVQALFAVGIAAVVGFDIAFQNEPLSRLDWLFLMVALIIGAAFLQGLTKSMKE